MPTTLLQYELDPTGLDAANLIAGETHTNVDTLTGILVPKFGDFFTESLIITNSANTPLVRNDDYVPIEFNQTASLKYGKEICRGILILTNKSLSPFTVTYQVLGGERSYSNENLLAVMQDKILPPQPIDYADIFDVPVEFPAAAHLHDIDEVYGFERIAAALNRVKTAIELGSFPAFQSMVGFLDSALLKIKIDMNAYLDNQMAAELVKFKDQFTKEYFEIDNIPNLKQAKHPDGYAAGAKAYLSTDITENKLMTLEALVGLKKAFFESFVRKQLTGLDLNTSVYGEPTAITVRDMPNRSTITIISKTVAVENDILFDQSIYPDEFSDNSELVILKVSNDLTNGSGDIIGFDQDTRTVYHGNVTQGWSGVEIQWKRNFPYDQLLNLKETVQAHIDDTANPHELTKYQIGLDKIENLPVVTKQELDDITSVRKYMTYDSLLYFMRTHLLQNGPTSIVPDNSQNKFLIDNAVVVYSPGGGCSADPMPVVTGLNGTVPTNTTIGWSINGGKPNSKFVMTTGLIGREPIVKEYRLNSVGSYVGYMNTGSYAGTIQSLFGFEAGVSIMQNTIVEQNDCAVDAPLLVKLSQACTLGTGGLDPYDPYDPYAVPVVNHELIGTYGYTSSPAAGPNFSQIIGNWSYCCGTREPALSIDVGNNNGIPFKTQFVGLSGGIPHSLVEIKLAYQDANAAEKIVYLNMRLDSYGYVGFNAMLGYYGTEISVIAINNQQTFSTALLDAFDSPTSDKDTIPYIRISNQKPGYQETIDVELTIAGVVFDQNYSLTYRNPLSGQDFNFSNAPTSFIGDNNTEVFNFIVPWSEINDTEFEIEVVLDIVAQ